MNPSNAIRKLEQMDNVHPDGQNLVLDRTDLTVKTLTAAGVTNTGGTTHTGAVINSSTVNNVGAVTNDAAVTTAGVTTHTGGNQTLMITTADAAVSISTANSGKIHLVPDLTADRIYTLPPNAAGLYYEFWSTRVDADGHDLQIVADNASDFYKGTLRWLDTNGATQYVLLSPDGSSDHTLNIILPIAFYIKMYCDGTNWFITGTVEADATPTWT